MTQTALPAITIAIDTIAQPSETTIGTVGAYTVVLTTALPDRGFTLTSSYVAAMIGDSAVSHLASAPGGPPHITQHVLPGEQPGQTDAQTCLLDHVAELQARLTALTDATVTIDVADATLASADAAWHAQDEPSG